MVSITSKEVTRRRAVAIGYTTFSNDGPRSLIPAALVKKGDVLATARIAGIMAAKRTSSLIPLCHPLNLTKVTVDAELVEDLRDATEVKARHHGGVKVTASVECHGSTGVEMEALTAVMGACLTVVDMCKGVDRGMTVEGVRVLLKRGGRGGEWRAEGFEEAPAATGGKIQTAPG
ncbi:MAG: hypothetical protein M1832_004372 [Thelocarpon impressellum]|nr:MAG: hypothetical protein M1832_004372 [Thelocarpon impressellum]